MQFEYNLWQFQQNIEVDGVRQPSISPEKLFPKTKVLT